MPITFPSCPASVFNGVQPGWLQTFAVLSYAPVNRKCPSVAVGRFNTASESRVMASKVFESDLHVFRNK